MRWAFFAAGIAAVTCVAAPVQAQSHGEALKLSGASTRAQPIAISDEREPAELMRRTSPQDAAADRAYDAPAAALLEADVDYLVREGRRAISRGEGGPVWTLAVFADSVASGDAAGARAALEAGPGGLRGGLGDMLEPFVFAVEGRVDAGVERVDTGADNAPAPLPDVARALLFESAGRLDEAAAVYSQMLERLDLRPPAEDEPATMEEFERSLQAARITHAVYRAALVNHRLGRTAEARRLYGIVQEFAPRSIDVRTNLSRLDAGEAPFEAPLDARTATGRWMLFLAEYVTQAENISAILSSQEPTPGLTSVSGAALLQLGALLASDADDWRLQAATQLIDAGGLAGAERVLAQVQPGAVFAPDADTLRASIQIKRQDFAGAAATADRIVAAAGDRWTLLASAGDIYRAANRPQQATQAFDRALTMVTEPEDRADVLGWRAYAHRFAGDIPAAVRDIRAAYEIDQSVDTRLMYVSILMDDRRAWRDGIQVARGLFAEQPNSVMRLNTLGYALIQQPEGLEEGFRLLWRGFNYGQSDYAVIDSLGWAYYLYGRFDEALALIERANALAVREPNSEVLDHLGDVYWRLNRRDEARDAWRQALAAQPDALRRRDLESKLQRGLTTPAPRRREVPVVTLPDRPSQREDL
ncbi:MAG: tetratricopeptide repeat protein [Hyphomonadaceae bacterium]|nr:tetratricopeptide repeat protein [Hyphomonadaceae bacterium]